MIRLKWIPSSVSGLFRSQDRCSIFTIYFPPHSICTIYTLIASTWMILFAFSVDFYGGLAHYAWRTSKITHLLLWNCLCLFLESVKTYLPKWCDPFLCVFAVRLPTHKATCLCHSNFVSHFLSSAEFSKKRSRWNWEAVVCVVCFLTFSPSFALISTDPC